MTSFLIIETSTQTASIAIVIDGELIQETSFLSDRRHNALLFEPLTQLLAKHTPQPFHTVLVGSGPGSYSGTRVGIATAQGAALISHCNAIAIPSILATPEATSGEKCLAIGDARRGSYWHCHIEGGKILQEPLLTDSTHLSTTLANAASTGEKIFCIEPIKDSPIPLSQPSASRLWHAWQNADPKTRSTWAGKTPQPIYLKPPHITPPKKTTPR